ncbi:apolipoprotein N-acyltransferase [Yoonia sp.]|uniref:apolipoprotein N-acyltransferase n=1 Tax=Yoonia sp. TaxID=2212373 RepID=UPI0019E15D7D|nr:apolipoprotein N-acyltransferase [Yoonia sp.]MBE0412458.1 apolipoprotein N-acyltransferase [Yoonia sp.]
MPDIFARLAALPVWQRFALLSLLGVVGGLGQAPFDLWPATIIALAILLQVHTVAPTARRATLDVWCFGLGYFGFTLHWIVEPFLVDIARHGWMAPFALVLMAGGAALFWALAGWLARRVAPGGAMFFGLMLVWAELTRALILTGFPWALLGHIWVPTPLAQLAAFGGPHLLSLITILAAWALTTLWHRRLVPGPIVIVVLGGVAGVLGSGPTPELRSDGPLVRIVQPNAPQHLKWDPAYRDVFLNRLLDLTGQGAVPDLVVWPETAVPSLLNYVQSDLSLLEGAARGAPLVFGIQRLDAAGAFYNSMVVMGPGGVIRDIYDKRHLVPFGEYIPGARQIEKLGLPGLAGLVGTGFTPGTQGDPLMIPGIGLAVPLICYEGIFAEEIVTGPTRPRLMVLITNDAWFGQAAGPHQHLAQARLRAIEQGLPMVRAANTGISAMIDAKGRIVDQVSLGVAGAIDVPLPLALPATPYARRGEWPFVGVLILLTFGFYAGGRRFGN